MITRTITYTKVKYTEYYLNDDCTSTEFIEREAIFKGELNEDDVKRNIAHPDVIIVINSIDIVNEKRRMDIETFIKNSVVEE